MLHLPSFMHGNLFGSLQGAWKDGFGFMLAGGFPFGSELAGTMGSILVYFVFQVG